MTFCGKLSVLDGCLLHISMVNTGESVVHMLGGTPVWVIEVVSRQPAPGQRMSEGAAHKATKSKSADLIERIMVHIGSVTTI